VNEEAIARDMLQSQKKTYFILIALSHSASFSGYERGLRVIKLHQNLPSCFSIFDKHKQIHQTYYETLPSFMKLADNY
jgi:hypothetical protein